MEITRLGFAGLQLTSGDTSIVIDAITSLGRMTDWVGDPLEPLPAPAPAQLALVTHLHRDHTDATALRAADVRRVLRPTAATGPGMEAIGTAEAEAELQGLEQQVLSPWETVTEGPFTITAVPAVDGFGHPQLSWVVEADGTRILHAGDTLFHGSWWLIAMRCGPIDIAFLPVNGAVADLPDRRPPSPLVACMDPRQAATAAMLLRAPHAVPIHYGAIHHPPVYAQGDDPAGTFVIEARAAGVEPIVVEVGERVEVAAAAS